MEMADMGRMDGFDQLQPDLLRVDSRKEPNT